MILPNSSTPEANPSSENFAEHGTFRHYQKLPDENELSIPLFDVDNDVTVTSNVASETDKGIWRVYPQKIPVKGAAIWLYFCCLVLFPIIIWVTCRNDQETLTIGLVFCAAGAIFIYPAMLAMLAFINESIGTEHYVRINEAKHLLELPRVGLKCKTDQVVAVTAFRIDDVIRTYVLIEDNGYTLYPAFRQCDARFKLSEQFAKKLSVPCHSFRYSLRQYRELENNQS